MVKQVPVGMIVGCTKKSGERILCENCAAKDTKEASSGQPPCKLERGASVLVKVVMVDEDLLTVEEHNAMNKPYN